MRRVFLDANILFSAANPGTHIARLVDRLCAVCPVVTSAVAHAEADRNLLAKWPAHHGGLPPLMAKLRLVNTALSPLPVPLAEKDRPILCAAIEAGCDLLLTGDRRDFGHLMGKAVKGVRVVDPAGVARLLQERIEQDVDP